MSILITRPEPEASATQVRLSALGFESVVAPVVAISATHQLAPLGFIMQRSRQVQTRCVGWNPD